MLSTPQCMEAVAEKLKQYKHHNVVIDTVMYAKKIQSMGCKAVIIKGGHAVGDATDILYDGNKMYYYKASRVDTKNTHGTGCTFSSAITAQLSKGLSIDNAVSKAKEYVTTAIMHSLPIGKGHGPTHHFYELYKNGSKNM